MIRSTSREAYASILPELGMRQSIVLGVLRLRGAMTNNEIAAHLNWPINCITPRVYELRKLGYVVEAGRRKCQVSGMAAYAWASKGTDTLF